jgi:hypothetical protein
MAKVTPKVKGDATTAFFAKMATDMADMSYEQGKKDENEAIAVMLEKSNVRNVKDAVALVRSRVGGKQPVGIGSYNTGVATMGSGY